MRKACPVPKNGSGTTPPSTAMRSAARAPQQRALYRQADLESAALYQRPVDGKARLTPQPGIGMDRQGRSRPAHRRRRTLAGGQGAAGRHLCQIRQCRRGRPQAPQEEPPERHPPAEDPAVRFGVLRLLWGALFDSRLGSLRLLDPWDQGHLLQQPDDPARGVGAARACRSQRADDDARSRGGSDASLCVSATNSPRLS